MKNENELVYLIYINDVQFTCILLNKNEERNIPKIIELPNLKLIKTEKNNDNSMKIYYKSDDIVKVKICLVNNERATTTIENNYPLSIKLTRLRYLLIPKIGDNFCFTYNGNLIQRQEENSFNLRYIVLNNSINLLIPNLTLKPDENSELRNNNNKDNLVLKHRKYNLNVNKFDSEDNHKICKNENYEKLNNEIDNKVFNEKLNTQIDNKEMNDENNNEDNYTFENHFDKSKNTEKIINQNKNMIINNKYKNEKDYEIINNNDNNQLYKIKISPEKTLTELREKIIELIPKRTKFLGIGKEIDPSNEDKTFVKEIVINQNEIYFEAPKEDKNETMEIEIYLNGTLYNKWDFYLSLKLKDFRNNLKMVESNAIIYKGNSLSKDQENKMTLDELCYKELKVFFVSLKDNKNSILNKDQKPINLIFEIKEYINSFEKTDNFETWLILGQEKSGKTTFINCLLNYCLEIKFEDKFRYLIKENNKNGYGKYDINGKSNKIRIIDFPGFTSEKDKNESNINNIEKFIKIVDKVKIICFVINGNTTRFTDEITIIFSTFLGIFGNDILNNFIFLFTHCDTKSPPVIKNINSSIFSQIVSKLQQSWCFKLNNSYLFETTQDFWKLGISWLNELINGLKNRTNISLQITKKFIDLKNSYEKNRNNFICLLYDFQNLKKTYDKLTNIDNYLINNKNDTIQYEEYFCNQCQNIENQNCRNNHKNYIKKLNFSSLKDLKNNHDLLNKLQSNYFQKLNENFRSSSFLFQQLKEYYELQLIKNNTLENDLKEFISQYDDNEQKLLLLSIKKQENLYNDFKTKNKKQYQNYLQFIESLSFDKII